MSSSSSSLLPDYSRPSPVDGYYDVFISFCDSDTRSFTTNLCHALHRSGIHSLMNEDTAAGDRLQMIQRSRIAIVVYSKNFGLTWDCLRELETIMEHRRTYGMKMIPIFYKVNLAELRPRLSGRTANILDNHLERVDDPGLLLKWIDALNEFGQVDGLSYNDDDHHQRAEYAFIDDLIAMIKKQHLPSKEQLDFSRPSPVDGYYGVLINFHGEDTVRYFTTYLCHSLRRSGIHTFMNSAMDDEGNDDDVRLQMIQRSRIAIVVYSENYASSRYSLMELEMIMDHRRTHGIVLIPIFYKVNLAELRSPLSGQTKDHLAKHKGRVDEFTRQMWMAAVIEFGIVPAGLSYKDDNQRDEYAFIDDVVAMIKKQQLPSTEQAVSYEYDVFLSFRGDDTRESFTGTLYHTLSRVHKVKTFMDVIFRKGSKLEELLKMVEKSRMSIVVFSENFAESEWCLKELVKIFEERDRRGQEVLPVFYKVNPSELRHQNSGKTKEHMDKHINTSRNDSDTVKSWSNAIKELGNSSGYTYWSGRGKQEVELAEEIAQEILTRLHG